MDLPLVCCLTSRRFVGDPIDVVTGANTDIAVDFRLQGPLPLRWRRFFSSARSTVAGALGWGQTHDFERTLTWDLDGFCYSDSFGVGIGFPSLDLGGEAVCVGSLLRRVSAKTYELVQAGLPVQLFEFHGSDETAPLRRLQHAQAQIDLHYDGQGRLCRIVDSLGRAIDIEPDSQGRVGGLFLADAESPRSPHRLMTYEYDASGNLVLGRDSQGAEFHFRWDAQHRMTCRTDRRGYSFHFAYDEQGRCIHSRGDDGLLEVSLDYHPEENLTYVQRGDGGRWIYVYNACGTVTQITDPYGGKISFAIDDSGRVVAETDANGNVTKHLYDDLGRPIGRLDPLGYVLPAYEADPDPPDPLAYELPETPMEWEHGSILWGRQIHSEGATDPVVLEFGVSRQTTGAQQLPAEPRRPALFEHRKYDPNGNLLEYQDSDGAAYRYVYASWNALHQEIDPLGNVTRLDYAFQGFVSRVQDPGGTVTEYVYDLKDRLSEVRRHGRIRDRYRYDAASNLIEKTDGEGRVLVTWKIGLVTLPRERRLACGDVHSFLYDKRGRIVAATTPDGKAEFAFAADGRRLSDVRDGLGVVHELDPGQVVATICFGKFRVSYDFEDRDELFITDPTGARHRIRASDSGLIAKYLANGSQELCAYDASGRCLQKVVARGGADPSPWVRSFRYSRTGDLLSAADSQQGTVVYRYDFAHRLSEEQFPEGSRRLFHFDPAGNLLSQPGLTGVEIASGNRLQAANGERFTYSDRDHLTTRQRPGRTICYHYNELDLLVRCEINGEVWSASYDALCRRISKTWRGCMTSYFWDDFRLIAEVQHDGTTRIYVYVDQTALVPFLFVEYPSQDSAADLGQRYYIVTNQVGVPVRVENDAGRTCWSARIDPYGLAHVSKGSTMQMPLRFPGHYFDEETGLHYNRFRYFSPELGRYLQSDPVGLEGGMNLYAYPVDPLTSADIDGLKKGQKVKSRNSGTCSECKKKGAVGCPHVPGPRTGGTPFEGVPPFKGKTVGTIRMALQEAGFSKKKPEKKLGDRPSSETWERVRSDAGGSTERVRIDAKGHPPKPGKAHLPKATTTAPHAHKELVTSSGQEFRCNDQGHKVKEGPKSPKTKEEAQMTKDAAAAAHIPIKA